MKKMRQQCGEATFTENAEYKVFIWKTCNIKC